MTVKAKTQRTVKQNLFTVVATLGLMVASMQPTFAAIEIDETDFGPSYETMVVIQSLASHYSSLMLSLVPQCISLVSPSHLLGVMQTKRSKNCLLSLGMPWEDV